MIDDEFLFVNLDKACKKFGKRADDRTDRKIFTCIAEHTKPQGICSVSQNTIAEETGYARRTVSTSIHRLAGKNLLTIEKDTTGCGGIASNIYHINPKYLTTKPWCSACVKPRVPRASEVRMLHDDMERLHDVLTDVVADILVAAAERNNK